METFGELQIELKGLPANEFGKLAEDAATGGWARDRSTDEQLAQSGGNVRLTFTLTGHAILPPAFLFVAQKTPDSLHVPNIISPARDRLNYGEYNDILTSFRDGVLTPVRQRHPIDFALVGTEVDLAKLLPADVFQRLRHFSAAANKKTGSLHPFDQERWMDFLIASDAEQAPLAPHTLARWLVEVEGWESDQAARLAEEYEFGRELLARRRRAS